MIGKVGARGSKLVFVGMDKQSRNGRNISVAWGENNFLKEVGKKTDNLPKVDGGKLAWWNGQ